MSREPVYDILTGLVRTLFVAQGLRIDIAGQDWIPRTGGAVLAVNHTAYLDFMEVGLVGRKSRRNVRFMMKAELEHGIVGFLMKHCKAIGVDRTAGAGSYRRALAALRDGELVVVYPEATISRSFELKEFKSGAARMAIDADVPIIPIVIWGAQRIWTKGFPKRLGRHRFPINIRIGEPISPAGPAAEPPADLTAELAVEPAAELAVEPAAEPAAGPAGDPTAYLTAELRTRMSELLEKAQKNYPMPEGAPWVPARFGGTAPTLAEAAALEREEMARRRAQGQTR